MKVEVQQLVKHFNDVRAVDGVSFTFGGGEIVGFIGPNGAGKTTTMRMMATLSQPCEGDVLYDSTSVVQNPEDIRRAIGYMPDSLPAHKDITVWEYLDFFARSYGIHGQTRTNVLKGVEEFTGLGEMRNKFLAELSKGMKQRVSLARAILHDPKVLIMDEPAAGLDPRARIELRELMKVLASQDKAILISSHILSELQGICNSTVIIEKGKILRSGGIKQVMQETAAEQTHQNIFIRAIDDTALNKIIVELPFVESCALADHDEYKIKYAGGDVEAATILHHLIERGVKVTEFRREAMNLEDLFMNVTKGEVS